MQEYDISGKAGRAVLVEEAACARALRQEKSALEETKREKPGAAGPQEKKHMEQDKAGEMGRGLISPHGPCESFCTCLMQLGGFEGS